MPQLKEENSVTATPNSTAVLVRRWAPWILAGQIVASILLAVISKYPWLDYVRDDFFYYLIVAQNFAAGHGSTFNGIVPTNGYHPLWMLVLAGLSLFTHNATAILVFVGIVCLVATLVCFLSLRDILEICGTDIFLSTALALWAAVFLLAQVLHRDGGGACHSLDVPSRAESHEGRGNGNGQGRAADRSAVLTAHAVTPGYRHFPGAFGD